MAHGYRPERLLLGALFFILLGGGLFAAGYHSGQMIPAHAEAYNIAQEGSKSGLYPTFYPWMYSLDTFVPLLNFGQKDYWRPLDPGATPVPLLPSLAPSIMAGSCPFFQAAIPAWMTSGGFLRVYRWVHIGVGWLLITLGIAGITGVVHKE
jgi:hypothetical protein